MSKTFPQESSKAFLNLKKSAWRRTRKTSPACFNRDFEKHFEKKMWLYLDSQKRNFWHSSTSFE